MKTLQVGLRDFIGEFGSFQRANAFMAACVMSTIPALVLFSLGQKNMVQGISAGYRQGVESAGSITSLHTCFIPLEGVRSEDFDSGRQIPV